MYETDICNGKGFAETKSRIKGYCLKNYFSLVKEDGGRRIELLWFGGLV